MAVGGDVRRRLVAVAGLVLSMPTAALAYRPFVSTDAAVAEPGTVEIEFGYAGFRRDGSQDAIVAPTVVANVGIGSDVELVGEFKVVHDVDGATQAEDSALSVKWVARDGFLQERGTAPSVALELSLLLPTIRTQNHPGGELAGIVSGTVLGWTYHLNAGPLVEAGEAEPGALWGAILEHALSEHLRAVGEVNGDSVHGDPADNSGLVGMIWKVDPPPSALHDLAFDVGVRRGISRAAVDWAGTAGLTFAFPW
jgi:hypothetical protein